MTQLSDEAAEALAGYRGWLDLDGITTLSDEAAMSLARHDGGALTLHGLKTVSENAVESLRRNPTVLLPTRFR